MTMEMRFGLEYMKSYKMDQRGQRRGKVVDAEQCGAPVAPHDASNAPFSYEVNETKGTVSLNGAGAYFGLAKVTNEGELSADSPPAVPTSITYTYIEGDEGVEEQDNHATFQVDYGSGVWQFILENQEYDGNGGGEQMENTQVTFHLDFSTYLADTAKTETQPYLNGTFNSWCGDCNPMTDEDGDGVYDITIPLAAGDHEYKFTAGGWNDQEMFTAGTVGTVDQNGDNVNRLLSVVPSMMEMIIGPVCWEAFVPCGDDDGQGSSVYADFSGLFGGITFDTATHVYNYPTGSEVWAGVANNNIDLYPFGFPNGGTITFLAAVQTADDSVNVNFRFERLPSPDVDPAFNTANVLVTRTPGSDGYEGVLYTVEIPAQDAANTYSSFIMYLVENDVSVEIHDVLVSVNP